MRIDINTRKIVEETAGLSPRGSRSGTERRSSGRRSGWTGSLVAVLTGG